MGLSDGANHAGPVPLGEPEQRHEGTPAGKRYLAAVPGSGQHELLFVRQRRKDARGKTMPYLCLGLCDLHDHRGAKPMRIDWRLRVPMPARFFEETKIAGG